MKGLNCVYFKLNFLLMWASQKIVEKDDGILFKDFVINIQKTTITVTVSWQILF